MTNLLVYAKRLFIITSLLSLNALGAPCDTALTDFPLTEIDYVGIKFRGPALCINAVEEKEARNRCGGGLLINPANPQYTDPEFNKSFIKDGKTPSIDVNPQGFFYCIPRDGYNKTKKALCVTEVIMERSTWSEDIKNKFEFKWKPKLGGGTDGDCTCRVKNTQDEFKVCNREPDPPPDYCAREGLSLAKVSEYENLPNFIELKCARAVCRCPDNKRFFASNIAKEQCAKSEEVKQEISATVKTPPATEPDSNLKSCVDTWKAEALNCKKVSEEARKSCDSGKEISKENKDTAKAIDTTSKLYTNMNAGTGAQQECFAGSMVADGAKSALSKANDSCDSGVTACASACSEEKLNKLRDSCYSKITTAEQPYDEAGGVTPNAKYFAENEAAINEITTTAQKICTTEVPEGKSQLSSLLESIGKSLQSSLKCMCQLSSGGANCNNIPTVSDCNMNPSGAGCSLYGAVNVCSPGATYDAKLCSCQLNPKSAGCPGGAASGGLANFASGTTLKNNVGSNAGGGVMAGNLKPSSGDINLPSGGSEISGGLELGSGSTDSKGTGGVGGGPGGGGPSGGSSGGAPPVAEGAVPEEKGLGGLFNQAKSFMSNALGLKKKNPTNGNIKSAKNTKGLDANKFRPTRGIAGRSGFGSKNQDIWIMMNRCIVAETCQNNNNNFLDPTLRHK